MSQISMHAPIGDLTISAEDNIIVSLDWGWAQEQNTNTLLQDAKSQLNDYFDGLRKNFDLSLEPPGTNFQQRVWSMMEQIPYGKTITYGEIAKALGSSARAVGMACGANPIPVIIPCHRVVAANDMGGYSGDGGIETKRALLHLERVLL